MKWLVIVTCGYEIVFVIVMKALKQDITKLDSLPTKLFHAVPSSYFYSFINAGNQRSIPMNQGSVPISGRRG